MVSLLVGRHHDASAVSMERELQSHSLKEEEAQPLMAEMVCERMHAKMRGRIWS